MKRTPLTRRTPLKRNTPMRRTSPNQRAYIKYLRSAWWKKRRQQALDEADGCCQECGSNKKVRVHHRSYARLGAERASDLAVLCEVCHNAEHGAYPRKP